MTADGFSQDVDREEEEEEKKKQKRKAIERTTLYLKNKCERTNKQARNENFLLHVHAHYHLITAFIIIVGFDKKIVVCLIFSIIRMNICGFVINNLTVFFLCLSTLTFLLSLSLLDVYIYIYIFIYFFFLFIIECKKHQPFFIY
jgi:hypothetical protein